MSESVTITVLKWDEYNPRKDLKSMPWFRIAADIGYSKTLYKLPVEAKWFWIFVLSTCAKEVSGTVEMEIDYLADYSGIEQESVKKYLEIFEKRKLISLDPNEPDRIRSASSGTILGDNENVPKRRGENGDENRKEDGEKNGVAGADPFLIFNDPVFEKASISKTLEWLDLYDAEFIKAQIPKLKEWSRAKKPPKAWDTFFEDWFERGYPDYLNRKKKPKKRSAGQEANALAYANNAYQSIINGGTLKPWKGDTPVDFEFLEKFGNTEKILNSTPAQKHGLLLDIKDVYLEIFDTG